MKREILFRVVENGKIIGYEFVGKRGWEWICIELNPDNGERWSPGVFPASCKLTREAFTGLKDKHGKKIFEGDTVRWDDGSNGKYWRVAKVIYDDNEAMFSFEIIGCINCNLKKGYIFGGNFMYRDGSHLEIIGSIHSTPELINQK